MWEEKSATPNFLGTTVLNSMVVSSALLASDRALPAEHSDFMLRGLN